ncbi:cyclophilin-like fold protein [Shewanella mangrovi]|uniref:cyclophilin-like fold protein n=1 Tax=Shewanella mangrovi TaxID=1515746 RepID=UPI00138E29DB|nr:cyclophilin-like fold protein [Shewanella mangrovi]
MRTQWLIACCSLGLCFSSAVFSATTHSTYSVQQENQVKIAIDIQGQTVTATLKANSEAVNDFVAQLPLSLTLTDYAATEKVADLPKRLSTKGEPAGTAAKAGDITYYAPWGNLAIFHKSFGHASGLVKLGTLDSGVELMKKSGAFDVTIRLAD